MSETGANGFILPDDLMQKIEEFAIKYAESPRGLIVAAVDHFCRLPEEQRKAVLIGTNRRRGGLI